MAGLPGASTNVINTDQPTRHARPRGRSALLVGAGLVLAALLGQTFLWSPHVHWAAKAAVGGVGLLAAWRPGVSLLALAAVVPFGRVISTAISPATQTGSTEALVLAFLAGWCWTRLRRPVDDRRDPPALRLGYLFSTIVLASLLVEIGILRYWKDYWQPFLGQLLLYVTRDYLSVNVETRPWVGRLGGLVSVPAAALFLEGCALTSVTRSLCRDDRAFGKRLLAVLAMASAGTAVLSIWSAWQLAGLEGNSLLSILRVHRIAAHTTKINTASSYYVLFLPVLIGLAAWTARPDRRPVPSRTIRSAAGSAGAALVLAALWLAGSRTALIAGLVVAVGAAAETIFPRRGGRTWGRSVAVGLILIGVLAAVLASGLYLKAENVVGGASLSRSLDVRLSMWRAALATASARPLFGVGIGQFPYQGAAFAPESAGLTTDVLGRFNAHNQFLEVTAELGLLGGMLFIGMFAVILRRAWRVFRASRDPVLGGAIAGVAAFLITCVAGQPLLYQIVAFPFWMVLGVVFAAGDAAAPVTDTSRYASGHRLTSRLIAGFLVVLAVSIPIRVWRGQDRVNFALAAYGFSDWHESTYGRSYRVVRDEGTLFTYPHARTLGLPIRRDVEAGRHPLQVAVLLDGRQTRALTLTDDEWQTIDIAIPADPERRFRRIDIVVRAPADVPARIRIARAEIVFDPAAEPGRAR